MYPRSFVILYSLTEIITVDIYVVYKKNKDDTIRIIKDSLNIEFSYKNNGLIFYHNGVSINVISILIISPILIYFYINEMKDLKNNYSKYYKVRKTCSM